MKKLLTTFALLAASACHHDPNAAEILAKSQNPDVVCDTAETRTNHIEIAVCYATSDDKKTTMAWLTATSKIYPFQAWPLKTYADLKAEREAAAKQQQQDGGSATPTPTDAGTGSAAPKK